MPITEELNNIKTLESVGFDHKQAEALTGIIEKAQVDGYENLKEFIHNEINSLHNEINSLRNDHNRKFDSIDNRFDGIDIKFSSIDTKFDSLRNELKAEIANTSKDLLIKLFGIIVGTVGMAVTILKLFP